jgi:hypothetical protein
MLPLYLARKEDLGRGRSRQGRFRRPFSVSKIGYISPMNYGHGGLDRSVSVIYCSWDRIVDCR